MIPGRSAEVHKIAIRYLDTVEVRSSSLLVPTIFLLKSIT
jgi:hypothetical protein